MTESNPPISISDRTPVKLPMTLWFTTVLFAFGIGGIWFTLKADVKRLEKDRDSDNIRIAVELSNIKQSTEKILLEVQREQKVQGELLVRIDERVKFIKP